MTIVKKFDTKNGVKPKFPRFLVGVVSLFLLILVLIEIWLSNTTVEYGSKFEKMAALEKVLEMENQMLRSEIAKHSSLFSISSKSAELGFSPPQSIQYIR
ncbi:MAG: hypothetical protein AAB414_02190 [Patescibacteria group bacterium]